MKSHIIRYLLFGRYRTDIGFFFGMVASLYDFHRRWSKFHGDLSHYKRKLEEALVVHALIRELEEVRDRANEKVSDSVGLF